MKTLRTFLKKCLHTVFPKVLAITACFAIFGSLTPAKAVTPQEGWYILGTAIAVDGGKEIPCYIIDNKLSDDWWTYSLSGGSVYAYDLLFEDIEGSDDIREVTNMGSVYYGWSEDDWRVDDDWYLQIYVASITAVPDTGTVKVVAWDRTRMPQIVTSGNTNGNNLIQGGSTVFLSGVSDWKGVDIDESMIGSSITVPMSSFGCYFPPLDHVPVHQSNMFYNMGTIDIDGTSINNLCIGIIPESSASASEYDKQARAQIGVRFLVPIDKCPTGLSVGDIWPKQWPLAVEVEDAYQEYYDRLLALGQITNPDDVNSVWGGLNDSANEAIGLPDFGTEETDIIDGVFSVLLPFGPIISVVAGILLVVALVRKGMN